MKTRNRIKKAKDEASSLPQSNLYSTALLKSQIMEPSFKIEAKGAVLNVKKTKSDRTRTPGVVWDIRQTRDKDPPKDRGKLQIALKRALKKKQRNIQNILDEPLPPIPENSPQPPSTSPQASATHSGHSRKGFTLPPQPQAVNKSSYSRSRDPWSSKHPFKKAAHSNSRHSSCTSKESGMDYASDLLSECKITGDLQEESPESPFDLKYLRWSQKVSRITFSYYQ